MLEAVICVLQNTSGYTLFIKRSQQKEFMPGVWSLPSGHVKKNELPKKAVHREFMEEFGISIIIKKLLFKYTEEENDRDEKVTKHIYLVKPISSLSAIRFNLIEADGALFLPFKEFFSKFSNNEHGHVLKILRNKYLSLGLR